MLEGQLAANGTVFGPGSYCHFPTGTLMHPAAAADSSCLFVTIFHGSSDVHTA